MEAGAARLSTESDNLRRADLALIGALPQVAEHLKVGEVNLTPDLLGVLGRLLGGRKEAQP